MILNPVQTYFGSKYQHWEEYKDSKEHKYWLIFRIIITILFFLFSGIGFIQSLNKIDFKLNAFLISSIFYFLIFGCWISNSRYFVPYSIHGFLFFYIY